MFADVSCKKYRGEFGDDAAHDAHSIGWEVEPVFSTREKFMDHCDLEEPTRDCEMLVGVKKCVMAVQHGLEDWFNAGF